MNKTILKTSSKIFFVLALLLFVACKKGSTSLYEMEIEYGTSKEFSFSEKINVEKIKNDKSTSFHYDYINFHSGIDSLVIYGDSLYMNGIRLKYLSKRDFVYEWGELEVKKYFYTGGHPHSFVNYYINNQNGILLSQIGNSVIVKYEFHRDSEEILNQIQKDSSFFKPEF